MNILSVFTILIMSFSVSGSNEQFLARADAYEKDGTLFRSNQLMIKTDKNNRIMSLYEITFPGNSVDLKRLERKGRAKAKRVVTIVRLTSENFSTTTGGEINLSVPDFFIESDSIKPLKFNLAFNKQTQRWQITKNSLVITSLVLNLNQNMEGATFFSMIFSPPKLSSIGLVSLNCENQDQYLEDTNDLFSVEKLNCI
jgi:hypothetical protein